MDKGVVLRGHSRVVQGTPGFEVNVYPDRINIHINDYVTQPSFTRIGYCDIDAQIRIETELLDDNSIKYRVCGVHWGWYRYRSEMNYQYNFHIHLYNINADGSERKIYERAFNAYGGTLDHHINSGSDILKEGIIKPNLSQDASVSIELFRLYNDAVGSSMDDEGYGGISIVNTNPPSFRPGMTLYKGSWESDNRNPEGMNLELRNGQWKEVRSINPYNIIEAQSLYCDTDKRWKSQDKVGNGR